MQPNMLTPLLIVHHRKLAALLASMTLDYNHARILHGLLLLVAVPASTSAQDGLLLAGVLFA